MATTVNSRDLALQAESPRLVSTTVAIIGGRGFSTAGFGGVVTPSGGVDLTAVVTVFTSPTITWTYSVSDAPNSWLSLGATGANKSISAANLVSYVGTSAWIKVKAEATQTGYLTAENTTQLDYTKGEEPVISTEVSPTSSVVSAYYDGSAYGFTSTAATIKVKVGANYINYDTAFPAGTFTVVATPTQVPTSSLTLNNSFTGSGTTQCNIPVVTAMATTTESATVTYTAAVKNLAGAVTTYTLDRIFTKAKSGANGSGSSGVVVALTNDAHTVPTDSAGNNGNFTGSGTQIHVYEGATELTYDGSGATNGTFTVTKVPTSITSAGAITDGGVYAVNPDITAMSADVGNILFTVTGKTSTGGTISQTSMQTFSKSKSGVAGSTPTAYTIMSNAAAVKKTIADVYTPSPITFSAYYAITGAPTAYSTYWSIDMSTDGATYGSVTNSGAATTASYTPSGASTKLVRARIYLESGRTTLLDTEVVPIVADGATGDTGVGGATGSPGVSTVYAYAPVTISSVPSMPTGEYTKTGTTTIPSGTTGVPPNGTWVAGGVTVTGWNTSSPTLSSGQIMLQSTGLYNDTTDITVWSAPYLASFRVGSLEALTVQTGSLTVTGNILMTGQAAANMRSGKTAYNDTTNSGFFLGNNSTTPIFHIGSSTNSLYWDGTNLNIKGTLSIGNNDFTLSGTNGSFLVDGDSSGTQLVKIIRSGGGSYTALRLTDTLAGCTSPTMLMNGNVTYASNADAVLYVTNTGTAYPITVLNDNSSTGRGMYVTASGATDELVHLYRYDGGEYSGLLVDANCTSTSVGTVHVNNSATTGNILGLSVVTNSSGTDIAIQGTNNASIGQVATSTYSFKSPAGGGAALINDGLLGVAGSLSMTAGFIYIPAGAGTPTGAPTSAGTANAALFYDTTNNRLWARANSTWKSVLLA